MNTGNYGSTDKNHSSYTNPEQIKYSYSSVNNYDSRDNERREPAQSSLYPSKHLSGSQPRVTTRYIHNINISEEILEFITTKTGPTTTDLIVFVKLMFREVNQQI